MDQSLVRFSALLTALRDGPLKRQDANAELIEPDWLRAKMADEVRRLAAVYRG